MKKLLSCCLFVCFISDVASAVTVQGIDFDFVTIGNAGNAADSTGYGAVNYVYQIGTYEITNGQWTAFVSAAGAPIGNPSSAYDTIAVWTGTNIPTDNVSWYEAAQFCNYLTSGDKYLGAYNFDQSGNFLGIDRALAISTYRIIYVIPTEDEWYKAAYYKGSGYSLYANGTNTPPWAGIDTNYSGAIGQPWEVGVGNGTQEQNGTFDMMGNLWEWNETAISSDRVYRGGCYYTGGISSSTLQAHYDPCYEYGDRGFRVASVAACPSADLTGDCFVDFEDLAVLVSQWLTGTP